MSCPIPISSSEIPGRWHPNQQAWTPDDPSDTVDVPVTVTVTQDPNAPQDVHAKFYPTLPTWKYDGAWSPAEPDAEIGGSTNEDPTGVLTSKPPPGKCFSEITFDGGSVKTVEVTDDKGNVIPGGPAAAGSSV